MTLRPTSHEPWSAKLKSEGGENKLLLTVYILYILYYIVRYMAKDRLPRLADGGRSRLRWCMSDRGTVQRVEGRSRISRIVVVVRAQMLQIW